MNQSTTKVKLPVMYAVKNQCIPARLTLMQRVFFARGLMPSNLADGLAIQDRAASLIAQLGILVERTGDSQLIGHANKLIEAWNTECDALFVGK